MTAFSKNYKVSKNLKFIKIFENYKVTRSFGYDQMVKKIYISIAFPVKIWNKYQIFEMFFKISVLHIHICDKMSTFLKYYKISNTQSVFQKLLYSCAHTYDVSKFKKSNEIVNKSSKLFVRFINKRKVYFHFSPFITGKKI